MDPRQREEIVCREIGKTHPLGEGVGGSGHVASVGISQVHTGEEARRGDGTAFPFSVELERLSEFGSRSYWYHGTITVGDDGKVASEVHMHEDSGMNTFLPDDETRERMERIRRDLHLT